MENQKVLEILYKVKACLVRNEWAIARDFVKVEINNLKGVTEQECMKNKYCFDWYCKYCSNMNCNSNTRGCL